MKTETPALTRLEVMRGLRWANWDAIFITLYIALTTGAFQIGLARYFGANDLWIGIITSVPSLAGALQIFTAYLADITSSRKHMVLKYATISRIPLLFIAVLPFLSPDFPRLHIFTTILILSAVIGAFAGPAFLAWLSDLVPPDHRGRYFGRRNMILGLVSAGAALPPAIFLDQAVKYERFSPAVAFSVLFGLGALLTIASLWALSRMPEPPRTPAPARGVKGLLDFYREPFRTRNFRLLLGFNSFLVFGQMFAGQFFTVYMLEQIKMPYLMVQVMGLIAALFSSLTMPVWGYLADKFGNKPLLILSLSGVTFLPYLWFLTDPERYLWSVNVIAFIQVLAGALWAGVGLTQFNLNVEVAPPQQRAVYMGALSTVVAVMGGIAAFSSGAVMEALKPYVADPARFFVLFALASIFRLLAFPWLKGIHEPQGRSAGYVIAQLRSSVRPRGWRAMRQLRRQSDEATRLQAIRTLAQERTPLAVEELVSALNDPVLEVRRESGRALGEIGDPRAVPALLRAMQDPASNIVMECAEALGKIGSPEAVPDLVNLIDHPQLEVRMSAIQALRQIADLRALNPLLERLTHAPGPLEQSSLLGAIEATLSRVSDPNLLTEVAGLETLVNWLDSPHANVRADCASALAQLPPDAQLAPIPRAHLKEERDPAVLTNLARALSRHGTLGDLPILARTMARVDSSLARQQIALSIARLAGQYERLYTLLTADEMGRDRLLERVLTPHLREHPELSDALRAYAYGDYRTAWQTLLSIYPDHPLLVSIREVPDCLESWLLAVSLL